MICHLSRVKRHFGPTIDERQQIAPRGGRPRRSDPRLGEQCAGDRGLQRTAAGEQHARQSRMKRQAPHLTAQRRELVAVQRPDPAQQLQRCADAPGLRGLIPVKARERAPCGENGEQRPGKIQAPYLGLALVYSVVSASWEGSGVAAAADASSTTFAGQAGLRYFMSEKLALQGQVGFGYGTLGLGVTWRM